jgi:tRNA_anti-like
VTQTNPTAGINKWLRLIFGLLLLFSFFIPWVSWATFDISGYDMPLGSFFSIAEKNFKLGNPFPQFNFVFLVFWLVPLLTVISILQAFRNGKNAFPGVVSGMLALTLVTVYLLFTRTLLNLGVGTTLLHGINFGLYLTILAATGTIVASLPKALWIKKIGFIIIGPLFAWAGFFFISNYLEKQEFGDTAHVKQDYTVNAIEMIREFTANDSLANAKYREKIIIVNGKISEKQQPNNSTVNIQINDTTGSYVIFDFQQEQVAETKTLKPGDTVSIKGSCSGGVYSDILGTEFITFKRCVLNK